MVFGSKIDFPALSRDMIHSSSSLDPSLAHSPTLLLESFSIAAITTTDAFFVG
jgi:hypothetical protein